MSAFIRDQLGLTLTDDTKNAPVAPLGTFRFMFDGQELNYSVNESPFMPFTNVTRWDRLNAPLGNSLINHADYATTFLWNAATGDKDLFTLMTSGNDTGTGVLLAVRTPGPTNSKSPLGVWARDLPALVVDNEGNVGINILDPTTGYKLDVQGAVNIDTGRINHDLILTTTATTNLFRHMTLDYYDASAHEVTAGRRGVYLSYTRQGTGTVSGSAFDAAFAIDPFVTTDLGYELKGMDIKGPLVAGGVTLATWSGLSVRAVTGPGTITSRRAIYTEKGAGDVVFNGNTILATTDTNGYVFLPVTDGPPTGVPATYTGARAVVLEENDPAFKLWAYIGADWREVSGSGGAVGGSDTEVLFNNGGVIDGAANLTWTNATSYLDLAGRMEIGHSTAEITERGLFVSTTLTGSNTQASQHYSNLFSFTDESTADSNLPYRAGTRFRYSRTSAGADYIAYGVISDVGFNHAADTLDAQLWSFKAMGNTGSGTSTLTTYGGYYAEYPTGFGFLTNTYGFIAEGGLFNGFGQVSPITLVHVGGGTFTGSGIPSGADTPTAFAVTDGSSGTPSASSSPAVSITRVLDNAYVGGSSGVMMLHGTKGGSAGDGFETLSVWARQTAAVNNGGMCAIYGRTVANWTGTNSSHFTYAGDMQRWVRCDSTVFEFNPNGVISRTITNATESGGVVTLTLSVAHDSWAAGDAVYIENVTGTIGVNGHKIILSAPTSTTITVAGTAGSYTSGGTVWLGGFNDYGTVGNRSQGVNIAAAGKGAHTAAVIIDRQDAGGGFVVGIDFRPGVIPTTISQRAIRIPNNTYLYGWNAGATDSFPLIGLHVAGGVVVDAAALGVFFGGGISISTTITFPDNVRQTFNPGATNAGLNVGAHTADPSSLTNGDIWYDSTGNLLRARVNGASITIGATTGKWNAITNPDGNQALTMTNYSSEWTWNTAFAGNGLLLQTSADGTDSGALLYVRTTHASAGKVPLRIDAQNAIAFYVDAVGRVGVRSTPNTSYDFTVTGDTYLGGDTDIAGRLTVTYSTATITDRTIFASSTLTGSNTQGSLQYSNLLSLTDQSTADSTLPYRSGTLFRYVRAAAGADYIAYGVVSDMQFNHSSATLDSELWSFKAQGNCGSSTSTLTTYGGYYAEYPSGFGNLTNAYGFVAEGGLFNGFGTTLPTATVHINGITRLDGFLSSGISAAPTYQVQLNSSLGSGSGTPTLVIEGNEDRTRIAVHTASDTAFPVVTLRRARGSLTGLSSPNSGDVLGVYGMASWDGTGGFIASQSVAMVGLAAENHSVSAKGSRFSLQVTKITEPSRTTRFTVEENGDIICWPNTTAIATTAAFGFLYVPHSAGPPSVAPFYAATYTAAVPIRIDSTNKRIYGYIGVAWENLSGSGGTPATPTGTLQYNNAGAFGSVTSSSVSGANVTLGGSLTVAFSASSTASVTDVGSGPLFTLYQAHSSFGTYPEVIFQKAAAGGGNISDTATTIGRISFQGMLAGVMTQVGSIAASRQSSVNRLDITFGTYAIGVTSAGVYLGGVTQAVGIDSTGVYIDLNSDATGDIFYRNSSGSLSRLAIGASGTFLKSTGTAPSWANIAAGDVTSGVFATARLGTGTADSTVFLRGDGTWATTTSAATKWNAIANPDGAQALTMANYASEWTWGTAFAGNGLLLQTNTTGDSGALLYVRTTHASAGKIPFRVDAQNVLSFYVDATGRVGVKTTPNTSYEFTVGGKSYLGGDTDVAGRLTATYSTSTLTNRTLFVASTLTGSDTQSSLYYANLLTLTDQSTAGTNVPYRTPMLFRYTRATAGSGFSVYGIVSDVGYSASSGTLDGPLWAFKAMGNTGSSTAVLTTYGGFYAEYPSGFGFLTNTYGFVAEGGLFNGFGTTLPIATVDVLGTTRLRNSTGVTTGLQTLVTFEHLCTGTPADGYGLSTPYNLSTTVQSRLAAQFDVAWQEATDADRSAVASIRTVHKGQTVAIRRQLWGGYKVLTDNTRTDIFSVVFAAADQKFASGTVHLTIFAKQVTGSNQIQVYRKSITFIAIHNGATNTGQGRWGLELTGDAISSFGGITFLFECNTVDYPLYAGTADTLTYQLTADTDLTTLAEFAVMYDVEWNGDIDLTLL